MKHVILDFDGVIADTFDFHLAKLNEFHDIDFTAEEYRKVHEGNFYNDTDSRIADLDFTGYPAFAKTEQALLPPYEGFIEALLKFSSLYKVHLVTSGFKEQILPFLVEKKIDNLFTTMLFADHGKSKHVKIESILAQQKISPTNDCVFVTDTLGDIVESHEAKVPVIAVTFGFHEEELLRKGSPEYIAHSWPEIEQIVSTHFLT